MSGVERRLRSRSLLALSLLGSLCALGICALTALGIWQLQRRVWKLQLIDEITRRVEAVPIDAPGPSEWPRVIAGEFTYRRIRAAGRYLNDRETLVRAVTRFGGGYWVLTPLSTEHGFTILVNRGFVPTERRDPATRAEGLIDDPAVVSGLLRISEPGGAFLQANDAGADRWYSRDVGAIAAARGLATTAPYFLDADATPIPGGFPVGGLTVLDLPNNHLVYALTWFALALLLAFTAGAFARAEWRGRGRA